MSNNTYIQNEAKKDFKDWTIEGLNHLKTKSWYKQIEQQAA